MFRTRLSVALSVFGCLHAAGLFLGAAEVSALKTAANSITSRDLKSHVEVLADDTFEGREAGTRGGQAAAGYLVKQLQDRSLKPAGDDGTYFQTFGRGYRNVMAMLEGADPDLKKEFIVLGAHYDHVGYGSRSNSYGPWGYIHNGADDNASGVAGVLETIDAFLTMQQPPRRSILFAFFDGEEKGLIGSKQWVATPLVPMKKVVFMVNVDMIGRMQNDRVEVYGSRTGRGLRRLCSETNALTSLKLDFNWEMKENSDHYSFFASHVPTMMMHTGLHADYHRPSDDANRLNLPGLENVSRFMFALVYELASRPDLAAFRAESINEYPGDKDSLEQTLPSAPPRLGLVWKSLQPDHPGALVEQVTQNSPADRAGIRVGDRVLQFAGKPVSEDRQFRLDIFSSASPASISVARAGVEKPLELSVPLAGSPGRIGISWREDNAEPGTVLVTQVVYGSPAYFAGLTEHDRIYSVSGHAFQGSKELHELLTTLASPMELQVECDGRLRAVSLELPPPNSATP